MGIFEALGLSAVIFTSAFGTLVLVYFAWQGIATARRQRERGEIDEALDIHNAIDDRQLIAKAGRIR